jgi:hypothetical protein
LKLYMKWKFPYVHMLRLWDNYMPDSSKSLTLFIYILFNIIIVLLLFHGLQNK